MNIIVIIGIIIALIGIILIILINQYNKFQWAKIKMDKGEVNIVDTLSKKYNILLRYFEFLKSNNVSIETNDGKIKEVRVSDLNFAPAVGDEVEIFENENSIIVSKKEKINSNNLINTNYDQSVPFQNNTIHNTRSSATVVICAIVGLLFPLIGAILYYVMRNSDIRAAKTANTCSWIGFFAQLLYYFFFLVSIFGVISIK